MEEAKKEAKKINPRDVKLTIKKQIMSALTANHRGVDIDILRAQAELDTGFSHRIIDRILYNMELVGMIEMKNGIVQLPE